MTDNNTLDFELVSPARRLISAPVALAVVPGEEGEIGVGPGHAPLVVALKAGVVRLYQGQDDQGPQRLFIAGGFADINPAGCTLLAEEALKVEDLDKDTLSQELSDFREDLGLAQEETDKVRISAKIALTEAKLAAAA